jgi:hypothetical protein
MPTWTDRFYFLLFVIRSMFCIIAFFLFFLCSLAFVRCLSLALFHHRFSVCCLSFVVFYHDIIKSTGFEQVNTTGVRGHQIGLLDHVWGY